MTQQYLAGELSLLLGWLQDAAGDQACARDIERLRRAAETGPLVALPAVVGRVLALTDVLCQRSLECGEAAAFDRQATICAQIYEFGECAGLLDGYST